ncbi:competence type IV pilus minor pilin ComGF [Carnobacterium mobile]|uniref:competence type IV pilus minor pilin ComGF n=1 Tax=Carnobacterium mobile TaxID=2750 RepID=UPI001865F179|nr:competence type IV pilus minor pilin ComGF [Carnobacterium mobile]
MKLLWKAAKKRKSASGIINTNEQSNCFHLKSISLNSKGFVLLETLIGMSVLMLSVSLISFSIGQFQTIRAQTFQDRQLEWQLFLNQFEYEIKGLALSDVTASKVRFEEKNTAGKVQRIIIYQKDLKKPVFIKTTDAGGYQPLLMQVSKFSFSKKEDILILQVTFSNKETYAAQINLAQTIEVPQK